MNVVIFGKGLGRARQLNLSGLRATGFVAVCVAVLGACGFAAGYWYSSLTGSGVSINDVAHLTAEIDQQRAEIQTIRQENEDTLDALAIRLAQINARVIRLDALGRRLTDMADLDDGEFDFDSEPALGGPEEPLMTGSNVPVPEIVETIEALDYQLSDREAQLGVLENLLMGENLQQRVHPQGRPVNSGWISSYFGRRTDPFTGKPANHTGIDFAGKLGDKVLAVADGVVTWSADRYGYGVMVEINHGNGYSTRYAHNSENLVTMGDEVKKGQPIALMGETGRATGPNLHFEVLKDGRRVNPVNFIRASSK
jgi:murein DD-endopeptidase MepM/ murein hydrolase activator NlpD